MSDFKSEEKIFVPDNTKIEEALSRTKVLCIAAHHDDIEIMAFSHIQECFDSDNAWFTGIVLTDGAGSPRAGKYAKFSDQEMIKLRMKEQIEAAKIGHYSAVIMLSEKSEDVKDSSNVELMNKISKYIEQCSPDVVLIHNLFDKHKTHVASAIKAIEALRRLPKSSQPSKVYAMEVWRGLDWLSDDAKVAFDTSKDEKLALDLLSVYKSQIQGGKKYEKAAIARRIANATFHLSHSVDNYQSVSYGMDITELVEDTTKTYEDFIQNHLNKFSQEVLENVRT